MGCTIISTPPGNSLSSCLLGIFLPVPTMVIGTTGTLAFAATVNAPCRENHIFKAANNQFVHDTEPGMGGRSYLEGIRQISKQGKS